MAALRLLCVILLAAAGICEGAQAAQPSRQRGAPAGPQSPPPERSAGDMRIAAVVNDDVISLYDVGARMRMLMISSNLPDTAETRQRIGGQVLRALIDEKLQLQEAKRQNIIANDEEIAKALGQIEKQNNMKAGQLDDFLKQRGVDRDSLVTQVSASIVWAKLVRRLAQQTTEVSDEEVDETLKRLREHANEPQSRVAEIFLAVDNPSQEEEVRRLAERLTEQMRHGARFSAVAQQFSQSATAAVGGDIGWVRPDQLPPDLAKVVGNMRPGELSSPVRTGAGYYLMLVVERRNGPGSGAQDTVYDLVQVVFPLPPQPSEAMRRAAVTEAQNVRASAKDCPTMLRIGKERGSKLSSEGKVRASEISPELRALVTKMAIGEVSQPIIQRNGVGVLMVCSKSAGTANTVSREDAAESLLRLKFDTLARRYMRDLRRSSYVDVRV